MSANSEPPVDLDALPVASKVDVENVSDDILHALHESWCLDPSAIKVTVEGGEVRLEGAVCSPVDRSIAGATALAEPGVTSVDNDLVVEKNL